MDTPVPIHPVEPPSFFCTIFARIDKRIFSGELPIGILKFPPAMKPVPAWKTPVVIVALRS